MTIAVERAPLRVAPGLRRLYEADGYQRRSLGFVVLCRRFCVYTANYSG